jgi:uncharacterized protein YlzI (FlbEa/FlbD family)
MNDLLAAALILLHTVDGYEVIVNPAHITSLHPSSEANRGPPNTLIAKGVRCVVGLSNGKFYSVVEECPAVRQMVESIP